MADSPVYPFSLANSIRNSEQSFWQASHRENVLCAGAIEEAIAAHFDGSHLNHEGAVEVVERFGFPRVNFVLANTVSQLNDDRFSNSNKEWANGFYLAPEELNGLNLRTDYIVRSHPAVVDGFINQARQLYQEQGIFNVGQCRSLSGEDLTGRVAVLDLGALTLNYQKPEWQLFIPENGFGCSPTAVGRRVFGVFLKDGMRGSFSRQDFIGILKDEHMPDWAQKRLAELKQPKQDNGMTMT